MIGFVNQGELYPRFTELVSKMGVDDFLGQESIQRYKLDVHSSDRERVNSTLSTLSKPGQILCREGIDSLTLLSLVLLHVFFSCFTGLIGLCHSHTAEQTTEVFNGKPYPEISPLAS